MSRYDPNQPIPFESRRVPLEIKVTLSFEKFSGFLTEFSANISMGGMFIKTASPQPEGTQFQLEFKLSDDFKLIQGSAEVVWVRGEDEGPGRPVGMGVRFLDLDEASRALIAKIVERHQAEGGQPFDLEQVGRGVKQTVRPPGLPPTEATLVLAAESLKLGGGTVEGSAQPAKPPPKSRPPAPQRPASPPPSPAASPPGRQAPGRQAPGQQAPPRPASAPPRPPAPAAAPRSYALAGRAQVRSPVRAVSRLLLLLLLGLGLGAVTIIFLQPDFVSDFVSDLLSEPETSTVVMATRPQDAAPRRGTGPHLRELPPAPPAAAGDASAQPAASPPPQGQPGTAAPAQGPLPPVASTSGGDGRLSRVDQISWRQAADETVVTLWGNGPFSQGRYTRLRLEEGSPREVVMVRGIDEPFTSSVLAAGTVELRQIRTGYHFKAEGNELHVVLDLASPAVRLTRVRSEGLQLHLHLGSSP